jgi:hypothetical protein
MKRYILPILCAVLLAWSCKNEKQMGPDPIISETTVGVYGISPADYVYKPVDCQLSRTYDAQGKLTLRIMNRKEGSFCQVSGIKADAAKGDTFQVGIQTANGESTAEVEVLQVDNSLLWLKARQGDMRIIVKK